MKKLAVMTWFHYPNFGTSLQVFALSNIVSSLGYNVDIINYIPIKKNLFFRILHAFKNRIIKGNNAITAEKAKANFEGFINKLKFTKKCQSPIDFEIINNKYDAFICGSDQIWSPTCFDEKYFLSFVKHNDKKIAYAPSIGVKKIVDKKIANKMASLISDFKYLSIRENEGAELINELCGLKPQVVLDPTLLYDKEQWKRIANISETEERYILCYFLGNNKAHWDNVTRISEELKLPVKVIPVYKKDFTRDFDVQDDVGPEEFLSLIYNSAFVCTDSFHGLAFSIIFNKPFYAFERFSNADKKSQNSRIHNLLQIVELKDRLIPFGKDLQSLNFNIDFKNAINLLEKQRQQSLNYLKGVLENV